MLLASIATLESLRTQKLLSNTQENIIHLETTRLAQEICTQCHIANPDKTTVARLVSLSSRLARTPADNVQDLLNWRGVDSLLATTTTATGTRTVTERLSHFKEIAPTAAAVATSQRLPSYSDWLSRSVVPNVQQKCDDLFQRYRDVANGIKVMPNLSPASRQALLDECQRAVTEQAREVLLTTLERLRIALGGRLQLCDFVVVWTEGVSTITEFTTQTREAVAALLTCVTKICPQACALTKQSEVSNATAAIFSHASQLAAEISELVESIYSVPSSDASPQSVSQRPSPTLQPRLLTCGSALVLLRRAPEKTATSKRASVHSDSSATEHTTQQRWDALVCDNSRPPLLERFAAFRRDHYGSDASPADGIGRIASQSANNDLTDETDANTVRAISTKTAPPQAPPPAPEPVLSRVEKRQQEVQIGKTAYPFLANSPACGVHLEDIELADDARVRPQLNRLRMERMSFGANSEPVLRQQSELNRVVAEIAEEHQKNTFVAREQYPFLPLRVDGVLLSNLTQMLDEDSQFTELTGLYWKLKPEHRSEIATEAVRLAHALALGSRYCVDQTKSAESVRLLQGVLKRNQERADAEAREAREATESAQREEAAQRMEAERLERERLKAESIAAHRLERERREAEHEEAERVEAEKREAQRQANQRLEAERIENERREAKRRETEARRAEHQRQELERRELERRELERLEAEREAARLEAARAEAERLEEELREAECQRVETERHEAEQREAKRLEAERLEMELRGAQRLEEERAEKARRREAEQREAEREEMKRLEENQRNAALRTAHANSAQLPEPSECTKQLVPHPPVSAAARTAAPAADDAAAALPRDVESAVNQMIAAPLRTADSHPATPSATLMTEEGKRTPRSSSTPALPPVAPVRETSCEHLHGGRPPRPSVLQPIVALQHTTRTPVDSRHQTPLLDTAAIPLPPAPRPSTSFASISRHASHQLAPLPSLHDEEPPLPLPSQSALPPPKVKVRLTDIQARPYTAQPPALLAKRALRRKSSGASTTLNAMSPRVRLNFTNEDSLQHVYTTACHAFGLKPNSGLVMSLPSEAGLFVSALDLSTNYVGAKGLQPLLYVIEQNGSHLRRLSLRNNRLENREVTQLTKVLLGNAGTQLTSLDLSHNMISQRGGKCILRLCQLQPSIRTVQVDGTFLPPAFASALKEVFSDVNRVQ